jgi:hypothetical protein
MRRPRLTRTAATLVALAIVAAASTAGCSKVLNHDTNNITIGSAPYIQGSDKVVTVTRALAEFDGVSVENGVTVFVRHGSRSSVDVTADDNLTGLIATDVAGGKLTIRVTGSLTTHNQIRLDVTSAKEIASVDVTNGSTLDTEDVTAPELRMSVNNGSTLRAGGKTTTLHLSVNNGSTGDLTNVEATTGEVMVDNGSTGTVNVTGVVTGSCHTGSTLHVKGGGLTTGVDKDAGSTVN